MNRNSQPKLNKTLPKNSYNPSNKLNHSRYYNPKQSLDSSHQLFQPSQTHFLNVAPPSSIQFQSPKPTQSKFNHHFASTTELISNPFQTKAYVPPHLNSSQVLKCIASQCQNWQVRPSSSKKLNYNSLYNAVQLRYEKAVPCGSRLKKWTAGSKIKNMVHKDRTRFEFRQPYKLYMEEEKSGSDGPDLDYLNDSARSQSQADRQEAGSANSSRMVSINNQSRLKGNANLVQTQA